MRGYSYAYIMKIRALAKRSKAPQAVQIGAEAIERGIPIAKIAQRVGVSRVTVYDWFTGKYEPTPPNLRKLKAYVIGKQS